MKWSTGSIVAVLLLIFLVLMLPLVALAQWPSGDGGAFPHVNPWATLGGFALQFVGSAIIKRKSSSNAKRRKRGPTIWNNVVGVGTQLMAGAHPITALAYGLTQGFVATGLHSQSSNWLEARRE